MNCSRSALFETRLIAKFRGFSGFVFNCETSFALCRGSNRLAYTHRSWYLLVLPVGSMKQDYYRKDRDLRRHRNFTEETKAAFRTYILGSAK